MNKKVKKEIMFAGRKLVLETGTMALSANMSIKASYGDTVMLVTAVAGGLTPDIDFFPLMVNYTEKLFASGTIKSSRFVKRDGRNTDEAIITQRLADHAIRPLFPADFRNEVQVTGSVLSLDDDADPEVLFMNAVSACLHASDIPWGGPAVSARVGYINGNYVLNPSRKQLLEESELDLTVSFAGDDKRFLAVEAEIDILPQEKVLGAIEFARNNLDELLKFIKDFAEELNPGLAKLEYDSCALPADMVKDINEFAKAKMTALMKKGLAKSELKVELGEMLEEIQAKFEGKYKKTAMAEAFAEVEKLTLRNLILDENYRTDGRGIKDIRNLSCEIGVLPRTHGSGMFTRGETQVLTVATLGSPSMALIVQDMYGEGTKSYMHFYNSPPYAGGEVGKMGGYPKNREIGHGMLAEKALRPVLPSQKEFPYTVLLSSEVLSSSGSTSMAATCGSTLALMDAGVPIKDMVGGISVGLIVNDDMTQHKILTDIAYMEDAFGFLDFKMTGTKKGVTAIQCDMKAKGIPMDWLAKIFDASTEARLKVLATMEALISKPKEEVSQFAPKMVTTMIEPDQIGMVIGAGGKTIKQIQETTGAEMTIEQDGMVIASSIDIEKAKAAIEYVQNMFREIEPGEEFEGRVEEIVDFGAFVEILPGKTGLLHVSEIAHEYVAQVSDFLKEGDIVKVKVLDVDRRSGKISLSKKALEQAPEGSDAPRDNGRGRDRDFRDRGGRPQKRFGGRK